MNRGREGTFGLTLIPILVQIAASQRNVIQNGPVHKSNTSMPSLLYLVHPSLSLPL
jgi:hypothetical protein